MTSWLSGFAEKAEELLNRVDQGAAAVVTGTNNGNATAAIPGSSLRVPVSSETHGNGGEESGASSNISSLDYQATVGSEGAHSIAADINDPPSSNSSSSYAMVTSAESTTPVGESNKDTAAEVVALRGEVQLLSQELQSVTVRARRAQRDLQECESKLRVQGEQLRAGERRIRDIEALEADHIETIKVRDTQIDALRQQLEDARATVSSEVAELAASDGMVVQRLREELQRSQQKSLALEEELSTERRRIRDLDLQLVQVKGEAESERESTQSRLAELERRLSQQRTSASEASAQLRHWQSEAERSKQEFTEYKEKANRVLQSKERLITSLQSSEEGNPAAGSPALQLQQLSAELEEIKSERDWLRDELANSRLAIENLKSEQLELEAQLATNNETAVERAQVAADSLQAERRQRMAATAEADKWRQAAESSESECVRTRIEYEGKVASLEQEVDRLRASANRPGSVSTTGHRAINAANNFTSVGDAELVGRLQALTESLVQKQLVVETITAEKNSLVAQLARVERQYRDIVEMSSGDDGTRSTNNSMVRSTSSNVLISGLNEEFSARLRPGGGGMANNGPVMRESAFDSPVARTAKQVVNQLDRFAAHTSVVFRRFPLARPFLLVYMVILHLWVTFVLLTYQPEVHHDTATFGNGGLMLPPMPVDSVHQVTATALPTDHH